ncbi:MAG: pre-peptidase C-terminal domain-containing protein [Chitinophagales bacterium]|nr:pre-peptidase C-terminal domain-containing protein [Chitinophagales bacterium]
MPFGVIAARPEFYRLQVPGFVENTGLVRDPHGITIKTIQYFFTSQGFHLALTDKGFSAEWLNALPSPEVSTEDYPDPEREWTLAHRVDFHLTDISSPIKWQATGQRVCEVHCYQNTLPHGGFEQVGVFDEITGRNVYPGIDLVFRYDAARGLHYHFVVHPDGDASRIGLDLLGAERYFLNENGALEVYTGGGGLQHSAPLTIRLSDRRPVATSFVIRNGRLGFRVNESEVRGQLYVIDPTLIWSSLLGGTEDDFSGEAAGDNKFKAILSGHTPSTTFIATTGAYQTVYAGGEYDIFCAKFKTSGAMEWCTYFGGSKKDINYGVALDYSTNSNGIVLFGNSISDSAVTTADAYQTQPAGKGDILITKFKGNGTLSWSTYMGGPYQEHARQGVVDGKGDIYFTGTTKSQHQIATPGSAFPTYQGGEGDAYVAKFSKNGTRLWASYIGGNGEDRHHAICLDSYGNIYLHGTTESSAGLATPGTHQTVYGGNTDAFLSRFDTTGTFYWNTYFGGSGEDMGRGIVADGAGNVYICGFTFSISGIASANAFQPAWTAGYNIGGYPLFDGYIAKFTPSGKQIWGTYCGGQENDVLNAVTFDQNEKLYTVGKTRSLTHIATSGSFQEQIGGAQDAMIVKMDTAGNRIWGTYVGGLLDDAFNGGRIGPDNMLYLAVDSDGKLPLSPGAHQTTIQGNSEAGAMKMDVQDNCLDVYEPNESLTAAYRIAPFSDTSLFGFSGSIASAADADWFSFKVNPTHIKVQLTGLTQDYDLKLYKKNGQLLFTSANSGTTPEVLVYNSAPKGTYYVEVVHASTAFDPADCYQLKVMTQTAPWREGLFTVASHGESMTLSLWPVPASTMLRISISTPEDLPVSILITDLSGRHLGTLFAQPLEGAVQLEWPVRHLPQGTYLVHCRQGESSLSGLFMVGH